MRIGIIGNGIVGNATGKALAPHVDEVLYYDVNPERCVNHMHAVCMDTDLVFVCLPTPQKQNSLECDTTIVEGFLRHMGGLLHNQNIVLRSTVPVGFTQSMREKYGLVNLVHSPEFLTARTAEHDAANPTRLVIGGPECEYENKQCGNYTRAGCCEDRLHGVYHKIWPNVPVFRMSSDESEFVKLMQNAYSATVISLLNEFRTLSDKRGMDWERCMAALLAGGWCAPHHTQVPGPDGKRGFGGSCLPKDINNLIACMHAEHLHAFVMEAVSMRNSHVDRKE